MATRPVVELHSQITEVAHAITTTSTVAAGLNPQGQGQGTLTTPQGLITWTRSSDGTLQAQGDGQTLTVRGQTQSDGSSQSHAEYSQNGSAPYLTMDSAGEAVQHEVQFTLSAGANQLTVTINNINAQVTSGTATLSGKWNGAVVNWSGPANLTTNPFLSHPISGWPAGAFAAELSRAAFFSPLGGLVAQSLIASQQTKTSGGLALPVQRTTGSTIGHAVAWCTGGAIAASAGGPAAAALGCLGGATGSALADLVDWLSSDDTPTQTQDSSEPSSGSSVFQTGVSSIIQRATDSVSDFQGSSGSAHGPSQDDDGVDTQSKQN